jgi:hypothetical protein
MPEENSLAPDHALIFVECRGVVLERARGPEPSLAEAIAGAPIRGSWWSHPRAHAILQAINLVRESPEVLVSRLANGRVTYVHSRLWPSLVRVASAWDPARLAWIRQEHTASGAHRTTATPFPVWVPADVLAAADRVTEEEARLQLGPWIPRGALSRRPVR